MRSFLITGGTGSLGRALAGYLLREWGAKRVVVYSRNEHIQQDMERSINDPRLRYFIGDVRDQARLEMAMRGVDVVIHAAAMKVVAKCEADPSEAIATNVVGANNVVHAAIRSGVDRVIAISTDKACAPLNLYGATKLCAEKLFLAAGVYNGPKFVVVRYGNVSGSRGSVIPLWREMKRQGRTAQVTDPEATRFWLFMDDAIETVMQGLRVPQSGIVIPRMRAYSVGDLAEAMGMAYEVVGLRAGEKKHETIISADEAASFAAVGDFYISGRPGSITPLWADQMALPVTGEIASHNADQIETGELKELLGLL